MKTLRTIKHMLLSSEHQMGWDARIIFWTLVKEVICARLTKAQVFIWYFVSRISVESLFNWTLICQNKRALKKKNAFVWRNWSETSVSLIAHYRHRVIAPSLYWLHSKRISLPAVIAHLRVRWREDNGEFLLWVLNFIELDNFTFF